MSQIVVLIHLLLINFQSTSFSHIVQLSYPGTASLLHSKHFNCYEQLLQLGISSLHNEHLSDPSGEKYPAGHILQLVAPNISE